MDPEKVAQLIREGMPQADVKVQSPDNTHFEAQVISEEFAGLPMLKRHQLVYSTLGDLMGGAIHALSLTTKTPDEQ